MRAVYMLIQVFGVGIIAYPFLAKNALGLRLYDNNEAIPFVLVGIAVALSASTMERREIKRIKKQNKSLAKCPYCAEDIQRHAKICKHCGRDLTS